MKLNQILLAALTVVAVDAHAALYDRGNGMIYDSTQNITWLQDANYGRASNYDWYGTGAMTWDSATSWADSLVYAGNSGWRLASAGLIGTTTFSYDGSTDWGYNNKRSEIGHLFFELGNKAWYDNNAYSQADSGVTNIAFTDASSGLSVSFLNVQTGDYWEAESMGPNLYYDSWAFNTLAGGQAHYSTDHRYFAWAVHDGDIANVSSVPVPATAWLFGSSLLGLAGTIRRNKSQSSRV